MKHNTMPDSRYSRMISDWTDETIIEAVARKERFIRDIVEKGLADHPDWKHKAWQAVNRIKLLDREFARRRA
jgi:hypothetical protein